MNSLEYAKSLDSQDNLSGVRDLFHIPKKTYADFTYLCGHSLGLQPKNTSSFVNQELEDWRNLGVLGHFDAKNPWYPYHEFLNKQSAHIVGAFEEEVVVMNSLTVNLHLLLTSFYNPTKNKNKIINFNIRKIDIIKKKQKLDPILSGVNFTRDLVSEPGNILHPDEYTKRLLPLKKFGIKVTVYDKKKLKKLGCNALLGV